MRARELGDVIPLWYGEGDIVTPAFIRDAAKAALDEGQTFYIPNMRGYAPLNEALSDTSRGCTAEPIPIARTTVTPGGMQALYLALELSGRYSAPTSSMSRRSGRTSTTPST